MKVLTVIILCIAIMIPNTQAEEKYEKATFAGGCFWCMEYPFTSLDGVIEVTSGYAGGEKKDPSYEEISRGTTGHREVIEIIYDPSKITYPELLDVFWRQINPTDPGGQFGDRGSQYETAVFYHNDAQKREAEESKKKLGESGKFDRSIVTKILKASDFYKAEEYHQGYYIKNPVRYKQYEEGSGRAPYKKKVWGDKEK